MVLFQNIKQTILVCTVKPIRLEKLKYIMFCWAACMKGTTHQVF
jgi:hypothetical protein